MFTFPSGFRTSGKRRNGRMHVIKKNLRALKNAFSMVELLAVVAIIGVILILIRPFSSKIMESANTTICASHLRELGIAINSYAFDHSLNLPSGIQNYPSGSGEGTDRWTDERDKGNPAVGWAWNYLNPSRKLFRCPLDTTISPYDIPPFPTQVYCSYAPNYSYMPVLNPDGTPKDDRVPAKINEAQRKMLLCDSISLSEGDHTKGTKESAVISIPANHNTVKDSISSRHNDGVNFLFGDGSVRWIRHDESIDYGVNAYLSRPK